MTTEERISKLEAVSTELQLKLNSKTDALGSQIDAAMNQAMSHGRKNLAVARNEILSIIKEQGDVIHEEIDGKGMAPGLRGRISKLEIELGGQGRMNQDVLDAIHRTNTKIESIAPPESKKVLHISKHAWTNLILAFVAAITVALTNYASNEPTSTAIPEATQKELQHTVDSLQREIRSMRREREGRRDRHPYELPPEQRPEGTER